MYCVFWYQSKITKYITQSEKGVGCMSDTELNINSERKNIMIEFIKLNNPTLNEINHRSFDIVMFEDARINKEQIIKSNIDT